MALTVHWLLTAPFGISWGHFYLFLFGRLQDSLEFINQDSVALKSDQNTVVNSFLGNIGNELVTWHTVANCPKSAFSLPCAAQCDIWIWLLLGTGLLPVMFGY